MGEMTFTGNRRGFRERLYRNILGLMVTLPCSFAAQAQPGVFATRPEDKSEGRFLTMEEAVIGRELYPETEEYSWRPESREFTFLKEGAIISFDCGTKKENVLLSRDEIESIAGGKVFSYIWLGKDEMAIKGASGTIVADVCTKTAKARLTFPADAENITLDKSGNNVFTKGNGLCYLDNYGNVHEIASDPDRNIIFGQTVSRNEFGISGGIFISGSGKKVAYYRKDESAVGTFPLLDINSRTGSLVEIKYPMAGMASENITLHVYDFASCTSIRLKADDFGREQYLTNVTWTPDEKHILVQVLDRSQKHMRLNMYDAETGAFVKTVLEEHDDRYVEPQDPVWFVKGSGTEFIYRTDNRDGYRNLYLCNLEGEIRRLTCTDADVAYAGNDGKYVYYTSAEVSPVENHLFRTGIRGGKTERLTFEEGWHNISLSGDCSYFIDSYSSLDVPGVINLCESDSMAKGGERKSSGSVHNLLTAKNPVEGYRFCEISLGTVRSADGRYDNYYRLIKPADFDPEKKYPVILYVYGGPHSQLVKNTWLGELRRWEMLMAQKGYIVYVQDNRGTQNRGAEFEKAIHRQCGQAEMADQMKGIEMLCSLPYVDSGRIGVHGWSYGGFMTISLITNYPDVFKTAVAGGPVIDWKWYEVMYGERYMDSPASNPEGYEKTSLIRKAADLKGKLLICQGAVDNVVVWEHSLSFIRECIKNNVQVDYFPYPCAQHNVMGRDRIHLMDKVTEYFETFLK